MQHPRFPIGNPYIDRIGLDDPEAFEALLTGHDARHIFFGHVDRPVFRTWRGITASVLPGMSHQLPLVRSSVVMPYDFEPTMYAVAHVEADGFVIKLDAPLDRHAAGVRVRAN